MNWVDITILLTLLCFTFEGFKRSFIGELLDFLSFFLAFILSLRFYNLLADFYKNSFQVSHSLSNVLGFISIWILSEIIFFILINFLPIKSNFLNKLDFRLRYLSLVPGFLRGVVFVAIILVLVGTFPIQPRIKLAVNHSKLGSFILEKAASLERPFKNVFGGITQDTLTFLTIKPKSGESVDLGFKTTDFKEDLNLEKEMIGLVNKERTSRGLKALEFNDNLRMVGLVHSEDMFERGYFSHYSPENKTIADRAEDRQIEYQVIGENLAFTPNLELAHNGLMNSPGHRANILSTD